MFVQWLTGSCKTRQKHDMLPNKQLSEQITAPWKACQLTTGSRSERASCVGLHVLCKTQPCHPEAAVGGSLSSLLANLLWLPAAGEANVQA